MEGTLSPLVNQKVNLNVFNYSLSAVFDLISGQIHSKIVYSECNYSEKMYGLTGDPLYLLWRVQKELK